MNLFWRHLVELVRISKDRVFVHQLEVLHGCLMHPGVSPEAEDELVAIEVLAVGSLLEKIRGHDLLLHASMNSLRLFGHVLF